MSAEGTRNLETARAVVEELARAGLTHACVCPGSRSAPLAFALAANPAIRVWMHVDERSASFFALGLARALRAPVALLSSSGTAAANFLPAIVEARLARVPLVVLTADRPPELRDLGAPQTIDQLRLYGDHVKLFVEMPTPELTDGLLRFARLAAARAVATAASGPAGPVHLNFPYREPLVPAPDEVAPALPLDAVVAVGRADREPYSRVSHGSRRLEPPAVARLAEELAAVSRGLIVCGPQDDPAFASSVTGLATALGFPLLADPLSQVRTGSHDLTLVVDNYDAFLRHTAICRALAPDLILRFGALPTSKPLQQFLQRYAERRQILIDGDAGWRDPLAIASALIHAEPSLLSRDVGAALPAARDALRSRQWAHTWLRVAGSTRVALRRELGASEEPFEGRVFAELANLLPAGATLFAGNSMPVRDLDTFFPSGARAIRFMANRGANGIDGVVSSALGAAAGTDAPVVLVIGDLSFYHDLNGLLAAKRHNLRLTVVLLNNDGGGIFSFLPQAAHRDQFEELFGTPTGLDFRHAAALYGATHTRATTWRAFREAVAAGIAGSGLAIVEVATGRDRNVDQHRAVWAAVAAALAEEA